MNEYTEAMTWLQTTLTTPPISGLTGGVHEHPAPQDTPEPFATISQQSSDDVAEVAIHRIWAEFLFTVRATKQTESTKELAAIADEIDTRLHRGSGTTAAARILACLREQPFFLPETVSGKPFRSLGGIYRLIVQPLNP